MTCLANALAVQPFFAVSAMPVQSLSKGNSAAARQPFTSESGQGTQIVAEQIPLDLSLWRSLEKETTAFSSQSCEVPSAAMEEESSIKDVNRLRFDYRTPFEKETRFVRVHKVIAQY